MNITCTNCQRQFDVDEARLGDTKAAMCECGTRLFLGSSPEQNKRLGKYDLIHKVATGGMGEIYYGKSSGVEGFEREVAIKRMLPHLSAERSFIDMMVKEAKLTVLLNHPNIVQIYDLSKQNDQYYIAMEYVPGITVGTLLEYVHRNQTLLPVEVAVHITLQLLHGLGYAHNFVDPKGNTLCIVHRDITPQNIMVTQRAFVKVTDFGIARAVNEISTTSPGMIKGKLGYIAPEQLTGIEPDHRVDLFCAGILLWEMLAAKRLFKGNTEVETFGLIAQAHIPSLDSVRQDIPAPLWAVILRSLAKDPKARYENAEAFAQAINQAIFPRVESAYAQSTVAYFAANPSLFAGVYQPDSDAEINPAAADAALPPVKTYTRIIAPPKPKVNMVAVGSLLFAGTVALGSGLYWASHRASTPQDQTTAHQAPAEPLAAPSAPAVPQPQAPSIDPAPALQEKPAEPPSVASTPHRHNEHKARKNQEPGEAAPLTGKEIQAVIVRRQSAIARCLNTGDRKTAPAEVNAHITIEMSGHVGEVTFTPEIADPALHCLSKALGALRFRKHPVEGLKVTVPLKIQVL